MSAPAAAPRLRPLGLGEVLDVGIKIYTRNWLTLWKIVVFVVLPAQILVNAVQVSALPSGVDLSGSSPGFGPRFTSTRVGISQHDAIVLLVGLFVGVVISFIAGQLAQAGCFRAIASAYLGEEARAGSSLRYAVRRLPALIVLTITSGLLTAIGFVFCIVPGVYLWGAFYVAVPALLVEGVGPFRALGRSRRLVKGRWWSTFGVAIVGFLLVAIISAALTGLLVGLAFANPPRNTATGFILNTLASTVGSMLTTPAAAAFATVLYIDLRVRKEGFDLLLLARGLDVEPGEAGPAAPAGAYLPPAPVASAEPPPYWPPPPGWTPAPQAEGGPSAPSPPPSEPAQPEQPPFWPPPPGWEPGKK